MKKPTKLPDVELMPIRKKPKMTIRELVSALSLYPDTMEVFIFDETTSKMKTITGFLTNSSMTRMELQSNGDEDDGSA